MYTWRRFADWAEPRTCHQLRGQHRQPPASSSAPSHPPRPARVCASCKRGRTARARASGVFHQCPTCDKCPCRCAHLRAIHARRFCPAAAGNVLRAAQVTGVWTASRARSAQTGRRGAEAHGCGHAHVRSAHAPAQAALRGAGRWIGRREDGRHRETEPGRVPFSLPSAFVLRGNVTLNHTWCFFRYIPRPPRKVVPSVPQSLSRSGLTSRNPRRAAAAVGNLARVNVQVSPRKRKRTGEAAVACRRSSAGQRRGPQTGPRRRGRPGPCHRAARWRSLPGPLQLTRDLRELRRPRRRPGRLTTRVVRVQALRAVASPPGSGRFVPRLPLCLPVPLCAPPDPALPEGQGTSVALSSTPPPGQHAGLRALPCRGRP